MTTSSDPLSGVVGTLFDQLKQQQALPAMSEQPELQKAQAEDFIIKSAGTLVQESLQALSIVKNTVITAPNAKDVESMATLISATANAIEALNKLVVADKKVGVLKEVKQMDIDSRKALLAAETDSKLLLTREEVLQQIVKDRELRQLNSISVESTPN